MGLLQVHGDGVKLEDGESEFLFPLYAQEIHSREVSQSEMQTFSCSSLPHSSEIRLLSPPLPSPSLPFSSSTPFIFKPLFAQLSSLTAWPLFLTVY